MTDQEFREMLFTALGEIKAQRREDNERLEKRLDVLETHVVQVRQEVGWIKGKLEGKQEINAKILPICSAGAAVGALILALIALFNR